MARNLIRILDSVYKFTDLLNPETYHSNKTLSLTQWTLSSKVYTWKEVLLLLGCFFSFRHIQSSPAAWLKDLFTFQHPSIPHLYSIQVFLPYLKKKKFIMQTTATKQYCIFSSDLTFKNLLSRGLFFLSKTIFALYCCFETTICHQSWLQKWWKGNRKRTTVMPYLHLLLSIFHYDVSDSWMFC